MSWRRANPNPNPERRHLFRKTIVTVDLLNVFENSFAVRCTARLPPPVPVHHRAARETRTPSLPPYTPVGQEPAATQASMEG